MKPNETVTWFEREAPGMGRLRLQAFRYGRGPVRKVLLMGMHGDELTPYYLVSRLLEREEPEDYTLEIVPVINAGGLLAGKRMDLIYDENYNRAFQKKGTENIVAAVSSALLEHVKDADFILDMHNWESPSVVFGMGFSPDGCSDDLLRVYASLGAVCVLDASWTVDYEATFGAALVGRPYFPIEYPPQRLLDEWTIADYSAKLDRTLKGEGSSQLPVVLGDRRALNSPRPGIFDPLVEPGSWVGEGEIIGSIIDPFDGFKVHQIRSDAPGMVMYFENRKFVLDGEPVCVLGTVSR